MYKKINRKLLAAYSKLLQREIEKISVTSLCDKAGIARATFYIYYSSMEEFYKKLSDYIIDKLFKQSVAIINCNDADFRTVIKKENLLFDDDEIYILRDMIKGTNYIDFATLTESYYADRKNDSLYTTEMWSNHKDGIDLFSRGYLPILLSDITDYNEVRFRNDMKYCRAYFHAMYEHMKN